MNTCDVCVVGGGPAGTAAAIAAAGRGASAVLVEATDVLGGMGTAGLVSFFCSAHHDGERVIIGGIFAEVRKRLAARRAIYLQPGGQAKMMEPYAADAFHAVLLEHEKGTGYFSAPAYCVCLVADARLLLQCSGWRERGKVACPLFARAPAPGRHADQATAPSSFRRRASSLRSSSTLAACSGRP